MKAILASEEDPRITQREYVDSLEEVMIGWAGDTEQILHDVKCAWIITAIQTLTPFFRHSKVWYNAVWERMRSGPSMLAQKTPLIQPLKPYLSLDGRATTDCSQACQPTPVPTAGQKCARWRPEYEQKGDCKCLTAYKCCDEGCPEVNVKSCWENNQKGTSDVMVFITFYNQRVIFWCVFASL